MSGGGSGRGSGSSNRESKYLVTRFGKNTY